METFELKVWFAAFAGKALDWLVSTGLSVLVVGAVAFVFVRFTRVAVKRFESILSDRAKKSSRVDDAGEVSQRIATLSSLLQKTVVVVIWSIAFMIALKEIGIDIAPILAGAGVIGLAVGFGAQNLVRDVVSGFFMILENQVGIGDVAVINGTGGLVESIGLRTIVLRDAAGAVHVFPNGTVNTLTNLTKDWSAMVFDIGVAYKEDTDQVASVMMEVAEELRGDPAFGELILEPMEIMGVDAFADSSVVIKARIKTKPIKQWYVGREYRRRLKKAFEEKGIEIPFPHQTLTWSEESKPIELLLNREPERSH